MFNLFNCLVHFDFGGIYRYIYTSICTTKWRGKFHGTSRWRISRGSEIHEIGSSSKQRQCPLLQLSFQSLGTAHTLTSIINAILMFLFFLDSSWLDINFIEIPSSKCPPLHGVFKVRRCSTCQNPGAPGRDPSVTAHRHVAPKPPPGDLWRRSTQTCCIFVGL